MFCDKRGEGNFDLLTVSETAQDAITDDKDNISGVQQLSRESTAANFNYSQQVLGDEKPMAFGKADPLGGGDAPAVGYRYRGSGRSATASPSSRAASSTARPSSRVRPCCSP